MGINRVAASAITPYNITPYKKKMPHVGGIKIKNITIRQPSH